MKNTKMYTENDEYRMKMIKMWRERRGSHVAGGSLDFEHFNEFWRYARSASQIQRRVPPTKIRNMHDGYSSNKL